MKRAIVLALVLVSSSALSAPAVFGMELGQMTERSLKAKYKVDHAGTNKYSNGNMYSVPVSSISFDGLQEVTTIFSSDGKLVAVLSTLSKHKFDYLKEVLGGKYQLVSQKTPFVGNKKAIYRDEDIEISLGASHMSFEMSMNYITDEFTQEFNKVSQAEERKKKQNEASQL
jgi:hypothetical protein